MDVLLLGVDPPVKRFLRQCVGASSPSPVRFHSLPYEGGIAARPGSWDVVVLDRKVNANPELAKAIKQDRLQGLKIVLTEKENLRSAIEFWGTGVYDYLLKPLNRESFQLLWNNVQERIDLGRKVSRLEKQRKKQKATILRQKEASKDLFLLHLKMQALIQDKTNFLARTSHELRTPLAALQGFLELSVNGKAGPLNELQSHLLNCSLESCRRLLRLANSLTDLSAMDGSQASLQLEVGNIRDCIARVLSELNAVAEGKGVVVEVECSAEIPPFRYDSDRMQQVIGNLAENAIKFTPPGGKVRLRCSPHFWERRTVREMIHASQDRRASDPASGFNSIRIVVEDTGLGIPVEFLQDIFEEYSRVTNGGGSPKGFGLGLAVARQIVVAHEGKIWAESQPGHGSTFTVLIPLAQ